MKQAPSMFGTQPFTRQQQTFLIVAAALLVVILIVTAFLVVSGAGAGGTERLWLALIFGAAVVLGSIIFLLGRSFYRARIHDGERLNQALQAQVLERQSTEESLRSENEYFEALSDTTLALVGRLNLTELLEDILRRAGELVGTQNGYVFLLDPKTNEMVMRVGVGAYKDFIGTQAESGVALAGKVWQTGDAVAVDDYRNWSGRLADPSRDVLRAVVGIPLKRSSGEGSAATEQVTGILGLAHLEPDKRFGPTEMDVLKRFASLASIALDNAQLYESAQEELAHRRNAEQFLDSIVDRLPTMLFIKEANDLRFVRWNKAAEEIAKRPASEMLGKNDYDFFPADEADFFVAKDRETLTKGQALDITEEPIQDSEGNIRWLHTKKFPVMGADGKPAFLVGISEDITDQKRAEDELRASEERYRDLFENASDMIQSVGTDGHFGYVNRTWKTVLGYTDQELEALTFLDIVHPDERQHCFELFGRVMEGQDLPGIETAFITSGGRKVLVEGSSTARRVDGQVVSTRGIFRDVTERRSAQERVTFQNALLSAQSEASPDGILVVSADDRVLLNNHRFVEMWNIPAGALATGSVEPIRQAVRENLTDVEGWLRRTAEIYANPTKNTHDEIEFKDGRILERYSAPIRSPDGAYLGRVWFFHDVTAIRRTEADIRRIIQGTRAIFWRAEVEQTQAESEQDLRFVWTLHVSNPDAAILYLPLELQAGQSFEDALSAATFDQDRVKMDQNSATALRNKAEGYTQEYRVRDANGVLHWMYEDARIRQLGEGRFEVVGVTTDVTERKQAEEQVQKQNAYLNALQETSLGLMQRLDVNSLLQDIVARAGALVGTENGYVFLPTPDADEMEMRVGVGAYEGFVGRRTQPGVGLAGRVWETNAPVVVDDYRNYGGRLADPSRDILRGVVGVPLRSNDRVVGIIGLAYLDETRRFGEAEVQVLQRFAQLATIALDNARLYETAQSELTERARVEDALAMQLSETELLNRVTGHAVTLDVDAALMEICHDLADYFRVEQSGIALLSEDRQTLTVVADHSPEGATSVVGYVIPVRGNPSTEIVMETRRALAFADAQTDPRLATVHDLMQARGVASILIAPLFIRDEVIGTLGIDSFERREYSDGDIVLVERVAQAISTALENARLYRAAQQELAERRRAEEAMRQRNQELEVISRVSAVMTTDIDTITALETLARELVQVFKARNCGIALLNPERTELTVVADALSEEHEEHAVGIVIPLEGNLSSQYVVEKRRSLVIPDAQTDPMTEPIHERMRQRRTKCLAIIPLLSGGDVIGTIGLDTTDPEHLFTEEEIRLAETMANQMASAIEKQRLFDQTKERARREQVTREIAANMTRSLELETILQTATRELSQALGASRVSARVGVGDSAGYGRTEKQVVYFREQDSFSMEDGAPEGAELATSNGDAPAGALCVPIHLREQVIGTVELGDGTPDRKWSENETALATSVVAQLGLAVENARLYEDSQERAREVAIVNEMARELSGELDQDKLFDTVYRYLGRLMPADALVVWLYDGATDTTTRAVLYDLGVRYPGEWNPATPSTRLRRVLETNAPVTVNLTREEWEAERARTEDIFGGSEPSASLLYVPLRVGNRIRGVLSAQSYSFAAYGEPQGVLLTAVANHVATAMQNAELFAETTLALQETQTLYEIGGRLNQVTSLEELVRTAAQPAFAQGAGSAQLLLIDYQGHQNPVAANVVVSLVAPGVPAALSEFTHFPIEHFQLGQAMLANPRELVLIENVMTNALLDEATRHVLIASRDQAVVLMPLSVEGRVLGAIAIGWSQPHTFSKQERRMYGALAAQLALVLNNRLLFDQTQEALAETQTLYEISARLNAAGSVQEALEAAAGPAIVQGAFTASLLRVHTDANGAPGELEFAALWPRNTELMFPVGTRFPGEYLAGTRGWIENPSEPLMVQDIRSDEQLTPAGRASYLANHVIASALLPLKIGERWIGVLNFNWQEPYKFHARDARLYRALMAQAATVLDNRSLFEQTRNALAQTESALVQVQEAQGRLNLQYQTADILARANSFEQAAPALLENTCRALDWQLGEYWAHDETTGRLALMHAWNQGGGALQTFASESVGMVFEPGQGLAGRTLKEGRARWVENIRDDPGFMHLGRADKAGLLSALAFPLQSDERKYGVTVFFSTRPRTSDDTLMATMVGIGSQISQFLERRRAEEAVRQQNTYLSALHDTALGLMRRRDLDELLQNIIARAAELGGTGHGYVHLLEPGGGELRMRVGIGIYQDFIGTRVKPGQGLAGTVWRNQEPIVVDDYRFWPGRLPMVDRDVLRAVAGVPLKSGSQTVGVLGLASLEEGRKFGAAQIEALNRFAELAALALDNAQLYNATQSALDQTRRLAQREKASAEIADKLYAAPDVSTVLKTAAEELRKSTGSRRAIVRLNLRQEPADTNGKSEGNGNK